MNTHSNCLTQSCEANKCPIERGTVAADMHTAMRHQCVAMVMGLLSDPGSTLIYNNNGSAVSHTGI